MPTETYDWKTDVEPMLNTAADNWIGANRMLPTALNQWIPTRADVAMYFLEVLPPIYRGNAFACSEAWCHDRNSRPVYLCFRRVNDEDNTAQAIYATLAELDSLLDAD